MKPALSDTLEVWLDSDLGPACRVGTLAHDRGQIRFRYHPQWLHDARAFALDPDLSLDGAPFYGLSHAQAVDVVASVVAVVDDWQTCARSIGLSNADIAGTQGAFSAHTRYRELSKQPSKQLQK